MDDFEWTDQRDRRRWSVSVGQPSSGMTSLPEPGTLRVTFRADGDAVQMNSPVRPKPGEDVVLEALLDVALSEGTEA